VTDTVPTVAGRRVDTLARLESDADVSVAASAGRPHLVPLSLAWDGAHVILATPAASPTASTSTPYTLLDDHGRLLRGRQGSSSYRRKRLNQPIKNGATVERIARQLGYESEVAFRKAFKREVGIPPARYRQRA
jgi:AraC-like DNA-binding protein